MSEALGNGTQFDRDTAVSMLDPTRFRAELSAAWWAVVGPNGGYLAAIALRAMRMAVANPARPPRSMHVRYLSAAVPGPVELHVQTVRAGRSVSVLDARMLQAGREVIRASATFGVSASKVSYCDARPPELPPLDQCVAFPKRLPINERYDMWRGLGGEVRNGERALSGGYIRLAEPRVPDALLLSALWDAWAPTPLFRRIEERCTGAAPTIEASIHFRALPPAPAAARESTSQSAPHDYYALRVESPWAAEGYFEESAEVWSLSGQLLLSARQLALIY